MSIEQSRVIDLTAIEDALRKHGRGVLAFSGGKESVLLAEELEPFKDRLTLAWVNTGAMLPHMESFVRGYGERFNLVELHSHQAGRFGRVGLPSRIVPIYNTPLGATAEREPPRLMVTDWVSCCSCLRGKPLLDYMDAHNMTLLIHGQRRLDNVHPLHSWPGWIDRLPPLWEWSEDDVMAAIDRKGCALPIQYQEGVLDSMECWNCPADLKPQRVRFLAKHYPELARQIGPLVGAIYGAVYDELERLKPMLMESLALSENGREGT